MITARLRVTFEAAHRLPHLGGKCANLHGHSWAAEYTLAGEFDPGSGTVVEFGAAKSALRGWVAAHLDHAVLLGEQDPLADILANFGRVCWFGTEDGVANGLSWPTVECVAELLARAGDVVLAEAALPAHVAQVVLTETATNAAVWTRP